jgi:dihydrofolate reductase
MILSLVAAIGKNNELGKNGALLWHMPADMKHFKEITSGHTVVMGRKTYESIGKPLPNRRNIVVTRDTNYTAEGVEIVHSVKTAIEKVKNENEVFIIGGTEIYKQFMPQANRLYITHVDASDAKANAFFPEIIPMVWNETSHEEHPADEKNPHAYVFSIYEKFI